MTTVPTDYRIEPELSAGTPRQVRFTRQTFGFRLFFGVFFGGISLLLLWIGINDIQEVSQLAAHGRTADASVLSKHEHSGKSTTYYVEYLFPTEMNLNLDNNLNTRGITGGEMITEEDSVSEAVYDRTRVGDHLLVTYLPSRPNLHRLGKVDQARLKDQERMWVLVDGMVIAGFALVTWLIERTFWRQRYLLREGRPVPGQITRFSAPRAGSRNPNYYFYYDYTVPGAGDFHGRDTVAVKQGKVLEKLTTVTILTDPKAPQKSCLYAGLSAVALLNK